jgi:hypothetical protein
VISGNRVKAEDHADFVLPERLFLSPFTFHFSPVTSHGLPLHLASFHPSLVPFHH